MSHLSRVFAIMKRRNPVSASPTTKAILRRLRQLGCDIPGPDEMWSIRRTHAGHIQRSAGAWSWTLDLKNRTLADEEHRKFDGVYGGYYPAVQCARKGATLSSSGYGFMTLDPPGV